MNQMTLNHRAQQVLKILVERYIQEGYPIGSRTIAEESTLGLSPATIRHILADLEGAGFLTSPHTSAGRVPTELGYRLFVNNLVTVKPLNDDAVQEIQEKLDPDLNVHSLIQSASLLLSSLTQMIAVVTVPRHDRLELRQVEFLGLSGNRVLVILVLNNREVQNRVIYTERVYSQSELQAVANYLNTHCSGKDLLAARDALRDALLVDREDMMRLLQIVVEVANKAFQGSQDAQHEYMMTGQNHLLNYAKETHPERLRALFNAITEKQDVLNILHQALEADGIQIFIGKESGYQAFDDCSIVTTSYAVEGQCIGSLGVIGLTRMPYDRVISAVDMTAKLLATALNQA